LRAHDDSESAAQQQEDEGRNDIAAADDLVIDGGQRTPEPAFAAPGGGQPAPQLDGADFTGIAGTPIGLDMAAEDHLSPMR
jgi:hypothetical protein